MRKRAGRTCKSFTPEQLNRIAVNQAEAKEPPVIEADGIIVRTRFFAKTPAINTDYSFRSVVSRLDLNILKSKLKDSRVYVCWCQSASACLKCEFLHASLPHVRKREESICPTLIVVCGKDLEGIGPSQRSIEGSTLYVCNA